MGSLEAVSFRLSRNQIRGSKQDGHSIMPFARTVSTFTLVMSPCAHVKLILGPSLRNFSLPGLLASHAEVAHSQAASEKYSNIDPTGRIGRAFKM